MFSPPACVRRIPRYSSVVSTVQEILSAMDKLSRDDLRVLELGVESRLAHDDEPGLQTAIDEALRDAEAHPDEGMSVEEVRALIPKWVSESKSIQPQ